jgi:hypothetical protein
LGLTFLATAPTAKRLWNTAQGCRAERLPWESSKGRVQTPTGLSQLLGDTQTDTTPLGFLLFRNCFLSQGSREARQPRAVSRNRFAVLLQDTNDNLLKAYTDLKR